MILMASYDGIIWDKMWHLCWLESISKIVGKNGDWWMIWIAWWLFDALGWIGIILDYLDGFMMIDWDLPPGKHIRKWSCSIAMLNHQWYDYDLDEIVWDCVVICKIYSCKRYWLVVMIDGIFIKFRSVVLKWAKNGLMMIGDWLWMFSGAEALDYSKVGRNKASWLNSL